MLDSFIPVALAVAPNPLGLPSHLKLTTVPIDAHTCFELWTPKTDDILLPEEAMLLRGDCSRLEEICAKLTSLLGARLMSNGARMQPTTDCWQEIRRVLYESGADFDAIAVTYLPQMIYPTATREGGVSAWTLQQAGWSVSFLALQPTKEGFRSTVLPIKAVIMSGQSITASARPAPVVPAYAQGVRK
ncbi:MAG: hypothetical protein KME45_14560 [Stenomitos rutilans HA7619-LM2]|jgi:hypothetical protein|nr:hypothetical protein [Stenomitos rutilans HA7619-LM2]